MKKYLFPERAGLVLSCAMISLECYRAEAITAYRIRNQGKGGWQDDFLVKELTRILACIRAQTPTETSWVDIIGTLAKAQQIARISHEEWEDVVEVRLKTTE